MGRGVYTPSNAAQIAFADSTEFEGDYEWYDEAISDACFVLEGQYPSLHKPRHRRWVGNEGRVILQNRLVDVVVSEYCGVVALSVVPNEDLPALAERWANQISLSGAIACFGRERHRLGSFSNGESVYRVV